jgi:hypothetical protein
MAVVVAIWDENRPDGDEWLILASTKVIQFHC